MYKNNYPYTNTYNHLIDAFKSLDEIEEELSKYFLKFSIKLDVPRKSWLSCPKCKALPKLWLFDNGRYAACKCHFNTYKHFDINCIGVSEYARGNNGSLVGYNDDELRTSWNNYCLIFGMFYKIHLKNYANLPRIYFYETHHPF